MVFVDVKHHVYSLTYGHKTVSTNHNIFEERPEVELSKGPSAYQPNALLLGVGHTDRGLFIAPHLQQREKYSMCREKSVHHSNLLMKRMLVVVSKKVTL